MSNLNVFTYGYNNWKYPRNWFSNIKQFFVNLKYAYQRATKGYCTYDIWDIDAFHVDVLIGALTRFRKDARSYPSEFASDKDGKAKWDAILNEMITHFKNYRDTDAIDNNEYADIYFAMIHATTEDGVDDRGLYFTRVNKDNWTDNERALGEQFTKRARELNDYKRQELGLGMRLLTKWHEDLWW